MGHSLTLFFSQFKYGWENVHDNGQNSKNRGFGNEKIYALVVWHYLARKPVTKIVHSPLSRDLASFDLSLFPNLGKKEMKRQRFVSLTTSNTLVKNISGQRVPRMFPVMTISSLEVQFYKGGIFWWWQHPLVIGTCFHKFIPGKKIPTLRIFLYGLFF